MARRSRVAGGDLAGRGGAEDLLAHGGDVPGGPTGDVPRRTGGDAGPGRLHEGHAERDRAGRGVLAGGGRLSAPHASSPLARPVLCRLPTVVVSCRGLRHFSRPPPAGSEKWAIVDSNHGP